MAIGHCGGEFSGTRNVKHELKSCMGGLVTGGKSPCCGD